MSDTAHSDRAHSDRAHFDTAHSDGTAPATVPPCTVAASVLLDELGEAISAMVLQPELFADPDGQQRLHRYRAQLEFVICASGARFEANGGHLADGAPNAAAWLATRCRVPQASVRRELAIGRALTGLPQTAAAFAAGEIGSAQAGVLARIARSRAGDALRAAEELLVEPAKELRFSFFERVAEYFAQHADEDGADARDLERRARRDVSLVKGFEGNWFGKMTLDPISGEIVSGELERLATRLYEADVNEARERLGRDPLVNELARTAAQRRADALVAMASRSAGSSDGASPAPLFTVLVGYETLHGRICELASGTVVSPGSLLPWIDQSLVERVVFGPGTRVEVGARRRFFTGATRRAIEVRDRHCTNPFCDEPAARCQVDHIVPHAAGGLTTQENGRLRCPRDNRGACREWDELDDATRAALVEEQRRAAEAAEAGEDAQTDHPVEDEQGPSPSSGEDPGCPDRAPPPWRAPAPPDSAPPR